MSTKDEYIKNIDVLEQMLKTLEDNNFNNNTIFEFRSIYGDVKDALDIAMRYKKWNLDVSYGMKKGQEIEYGIGIYIFKNITNHGDIEPEELLKISFPTGAYIFGDDYYTKFFDEFFEALKLVKPKYKDDINHALYYSSDNGKEAYEHYKKTYEEYREKYKEYVKQRKIERLEEELKALKV